MFPSSGDLWIYDFIMVNRGGGGNLRVSKARGWLSTSKARSQALVRQPARVKVNKKARVPPAPGQARNSVEQG